MVDPAISAVIVSAIFTIISGLVGLEYRNLRLRVRALEDGNVADAEERQSLLDRVNTMWNFLFGVESDPEDTGLSGDIQDGFDNIEDELGETKAQQEEYHTLEMDAIETLVNELHDSDDVDIERDDVFEDD